jgi:hypothetical protein
MTTLMRLKGSVRRYLALFEAPYLASTLRTLQPESVLAETFWNLQKRLKLEILEKGVNARKH